MEKKRKEKGAESVAFGGVGIIVLRHGRRRRRPNLSSASSETEGPNDPALGSSWLNGLRLQLDGGGGYSQCTAKVGAVVLRHGRRRRRPNLSSASSETEGPNDPALGSSWLNGLRLQLDGGGGYSQCTAKVGAVVLRHGRRRRRIEVRSARPLA